MINQKWIVGGVPEHFNLPWQRALENGLFVSKGIDLDFREYPTGTGAMCADLRAGELDLAVVLTEGVLMDIALYQQTVLVAPFVSSSLSWGVYVNPGSDLAGGLSTKKMAVSRLGSGSHLMGLLWLQQQGISLDSDLIIPSGSLQQLQVALQQQQADYFLWEKGMTSPLVESGLLERVDTIVTPWPCFMIAGRRESLLQREESLSVLLQQVYRQSQMCQHDRSQTLKDISNRYGLSDTDAASWFDDLEWAVHTELPLAALQMTLSTLRSLALIPERPFSLPEFIWQPRRATA